ncbi:DNA-processing protein DprA [Rhodopila sp.]|jgi:DNA processing protein|uniref:DNA-processing protein DprA n=1 Tax=Rhodopila sp. TaxID=2480087 RepID=UPI002CE9C026|nr:DNA-processing protein DprA [Rhodopila sp.]HVZ08955.1 DNA-processing protein DprA [Rhodopila sp.]
MPVRTEQQDDGRQNGDRRDLQDIIDRLRLIRTEGVGPIAYRRLLERYASPAAALSALPHLARAGGRTVPAAIPSADQAWREIAATRKAGGRLVFVDDADYPPLLALLDDAPPCLIAAGDLSLAQAGCIALVGGRNASLNGRRMAESLAAALAPVLPVASGLARGIDTAAHHGALGTGRTIAVTAGGLDQPYPPENAALQARIAEAGLVLTEAPVGTEPQARQFPRRNRIIAGLSLGVVVVEAAQRSGSLITARLAQDAGREVFAVPGSPLDPRARGGNDLIRQGAVLVETAADILDNLPAAPVAPKPRFSLAEAAVAPPRPPPDTPDMILSLLSPDGTALDELVRHCHLPPAATMAVLLELELAGRIEMLPGNRVALLPA